MTEHNKIPSAESLATKKNALAYTQPVDKHAMMSQVRQVDASVLKEGATVDKNALRSELRTVEPNLQPTKTVSKRDLLSEVRHGQDLHETPVLKAEVLKEVLPEDATPHPAVSAATLQAVGTKNLHHVETVNQISLLSDVRAQHGTGLQHTEVKSIKDLHSEVRNAPVTLHPTATVNKQGLLSEVRAGVDILESTTPISAKVVEQALSDRTEDPSTIKAVPAVVSQQTLQSVGTKNLKETATKSVGALQTEVRTAHPTLNHVATKSVSDLQHEVRTTHPSLKGTRTCSKKDLMTEVRTVEPHLHETLVLNKDILKQALDTDVTHPAIAAESLKGAKLHETPQPIKSVVQAVVNEVAGEDVSVPVPAVATAAVLYGKSHLKETKTVDKHQVLTDVRQQHGGKNMTHTDTVDKSALRTELRHSAKQLHPSVTVDRDALRTAVRSEKVELKASSTCNKSEMMKQVRAAK